MVQPGRGDVQRQRPESWASNSNLFLTSDERSDRQPQHRYYIGVENPPGRKQDTATIILRSRSLLLNGKRVRGLLRLRAL